MKVRRLLSALLLILCGITLWGCSGKRTNIEPLQEYYIEHLVPYSFFHKMEKNNDSSFLAFAQDFKSMWISFDTLTEHQQISFVVTSCQRKNGQINGTVSRIGDDRDGTNRGKLITYSFRSDDTLIYLQTLVEINVYTATDSHELVTIQKDTDVARFYRTAPKYITGGGA